MPKRPYERRGGPTKQEWLAQQRAGTPAPRRTRPAAPCVSCGDPVPSPAPAVAKKPKPAELFPCINRGGQVGTTTCELAGCRSRIKVYSCTLLQECTLSPNVPSKPYCGNCDRREPPTLVSINPLSSAGPPAH